jgi:hypothetical protein
LRGVAGEWASEVEALKSTVKSLWGELSNFTFTRFMIKKRHGTGNISGAVEPV